MDINAGYSRTGYLATGEMTLVLENFVGTCDSIKYYVYGSPVTSPSTNLPLMDACNWTIWSLYYGLTQVVGYYALPFSDTGGTWYYKADPISISSFPPGYSFPPSYLPAYCSMPLLARADLGPYGWARYFHTFTLKGGDVNRDEVIDVSDLALYGAQEGQTGQDLLADINDDCVVNEEDLTIITANYGQGVENEGVATILFYPNG